jgi:hypothetical protein
VQECRFITPSQGAGLIVLSMGDGIPTHLSFRSPDPTISIQMTQGLAFINIQKFLTNLQRRRKTHKSVSQYGQMI